MCLWCLHMGDHYNLLLHLSYLKLLLWRRSCKLRERSLVEIKWVDYGKLFGEYKNQIMLKVFMWRAMNNALPTMGNLEQRKVIQTSWCPWCGLETETVLHAIWECEEIKECRDESYVTVSNEIHYWDFLTLTTGNEGS